MLASQRARGAKVSVIDADPNHPIAAWGKEAVFSHPCAPCAGLTASGRLRRLAK
ncbi:MAG: hypothetical protein QHC40_11055 [Sphingobium sp.]|nr:hypothetical protein [Sphingobium sp.]